MIDGKVPFVCFGVAMPDDRSMNEDFVRLLDEGLVDVYIIDDEHNVVVETTRPRITQR